MGEKTPPNIVIALPQTAAALDRVRAIAPGCSLHLIEPFPRGTALPQETIARCTVLLTDFAPSNLEHMERLEWIQLGSAGYEQLTGLPLRSMNLRVTNASGVNDVPIAEWCILMMLVFARDLPAMLGMQQEHRWGRDVTFQAELRGRRVGIVGYGNIGRETARACRALGMEVWAMSRTPIGPRPHRYAPPGTGDPEGRVPDRTFRLDQMAEFLPCLHYLVLTAALNGESRGLLGAAELRLLPPSAVLLNPARAQLVDEGALRTALQEGWIAGAALDSHYREPMELGDPFWTLPHTVLTPHISGSGGSTHFVERLGELFALNLERYLRDEPLLNEVSWDDIGAR